MIDFSLIAKTDRTPLDIIENIMVLAVRLYEQGNYVCQIHWSGGFGNLDVGIYTAKEAKDEFGFIEWRPEENIKRFQSQYDDAHKLSEIEELMKGLLR